MSKQMTLAVVAFVWLAAALVGCDDEGNGARDGGVNGDVASDQGGDADLDGGQDPDGGEDEDGSGDAGGDAADLDAGGDTRDAPLETGEDIAGTPLEGIAVRFEAALDLCDGRHPGVSLDEAAERRIRLAVPAQVRADLTDETLGAAVLADASLERGPFAAQHYDVAQATSALGRYAVLLYEGSAVLEAEVVHDLGAAGELHEIYDVERHEGSGEAVVVTGAGEVRFAWVPPGEAAPVLLEPCAGPPGAEEAVAVLAAVDGERSVQFWRYFRADEAGQLRQWHGTRWIDSENFFYDRYSSDRWAMIAAGGGAGAEASRLDLTRDVGRYHTVFRAWQEDETLPLAPELARVDFLDLGSENARVALQVLDPEVEAMTGQELEPQGTWTRIDEAALSRRSEGSCDGVDIFALGYRDYVLQLVTCPGDGPMGFDLTAVAVATFLAGPDLVGQILSGDAIVDATIAGRPGHVVSAGEFDIEISRTPSDEGFFVTIKDGDGQNVEEIYAFAFELAQALAGVSDHTIRAADAEAGVEMALARRWVEFGVGESSIYAPLWFSLTFGGETHLVRAYDRLEYSNTHHNWQDSLVAETDELRLTWAYSFSPGPATHTVAAETLEGEVVLAPTVVEELFEE